MLAKHFLSLSISHPLGVYKLLLVLLTIVIAQQSKSYDWTHVKCVNLFAMPVCVCSHSSMWRVKRREERRNLGPISNDAVETLWDHTKLLMKWVSRMNTRWTVDRVSFFYSILFFLLCEWPQVTKTCTSLCHSIVLASWPLVLTYSRHDYIISYMKKSSLEEIDFLCDFFLSRPSVHSYS